MEFGWSAEQEALYDRVWRFGVDHLNRDVLRRDREGAFPEEEWRSLGELGFFGLCLPERYGGMGLSALDTALAVEALGRGCSDLGLVFSACAHLFACCMPIALHATPEVADRMLQRLRTGEWIGAHAMTEPEAGSDAFALRSRAVREGDRYLLTGTKSFVTNGPGADVFVVYASTAPEHGHLGISGFVVERSAPGLTVGQPFETPGLRTAPMCSIYMDRCEVAAAQRLGEEGSGATSFRDSMRWERCCLFAMYVGAMDRQIGLAVEHARQRKQFRRPLGKHQAVAHRLADMKLRLEAARLLLYRACWHLDRGEDATAEIALSKLAISEGSVRSALDLVQIFGGAGFVTETGVEQAVRDALPSTLFSGTSEIQRDLVARGLGL